MYAGEGASISIIDADPSSPNLQNNYRYPIKRAAVGHQGVVPVKRVLDFDVDGANNGQRLRWTDLIQTPGEGGFLHLWEEDSTLANNPQIADPHDLIGWVTDPEGVRHKKLLFTGDSAAGFRIFTYEQGQ